MQKDHQIVWNNCLQIIRDNVGEQSFRTWFAPIKPLRLINKTLTLQVPSQFFFEWLEEHYVYLLRKAIDAEIGLDGQLEYSVIVENNSKQNKPIPLNLANTQNNQNTHSKYAPKNRADHRIQEYGKHNYDGPFSFQDIESLKQASHLNTKYDFDSYIEGDCNRLARSAGYAVAMKPGNTAFNPLMLYGGVGLGKTHLVQAIGNEIKKSFDDKFVLYVSSEKFTSQFIEALKNNNVQKFTNFYLQVEVLIIDDIQFLSGKEKTQEIFFHIFNHLHQSGKQIIMTSDCPPRDLHGLTERLISRFKWGLTADLQTPDFETRIAIIQRKMQSDGMYVPDDVIEYIAYNVDTNVRELEGILISLIAHASLNERNVDLELTKQILKNIIQNTEPELNVDQIQKTTSKQFNINLEELKSKTRKKEVVTARQVAMYLSKEYTKHSLKVIGYHFGGRDHATVIHAVKCVQDMIENNPHVAEDIRSIKTKLKIKK
ncbi:chromosomal replication initiator protein DnaA [Catalinimonas niigatensis]|uniref:chromosomal replication initiator protein DnaA n=1 Tax=Catalinimonas niigatensis TaxID=1397264 RepID=UPI002666D1F9|nr:chromosomal replication initiator protein DnaA [Catalinimonas niigatensis]WPP53708.1 chromosomal replication initiator protein DnaA [Catalinimonas niigatensis]